jgi:hypothetical protein
VSRSKLGGGAAAIFTLISLASYAAAQGEPRIRIDAYGYVRWNRAAIDPSNGAERYHFRVNTANGGGRVSGGFGVDVPGRLNGTISDLKADPASIKPGITGPPRAKVYGASIFQGKKYRVQIDVIGDYNMASRTAGQRALYVPGTIKLRLIGPLIAPPGNKTPPAVQEAASVKGTQVRFEIRWPDPKSPGRGRGGAIGVPRSP